MELIWNWIWSGLDITFHGFRRPTGAGNNQDTACVPVYRHRRISKTKHTLKSKKYPSDYVDGENYHENEMTSNSRSKKHEHERSRKLSEEMNAQRQTPDEDSGIIKHTNTHGKIIVVSTSDKQKFIIPGINSSRVKEKRTSKDALRIANEYYKLEKHYKTVQEECQKLNNILEQRESEYRKVCSHYETLIEMVQELEEAKVNLIKQNQKLETERVQSNQDITLLKSIVYQLNTELERYQDKLRDQKLDISTHVESNEEKYDPRIWGNINFHALGPLLNAYQENLSEKRELVHMYEHEMADFGSRCKEIITENEIMHKEVKELTSECDRYTKEIKTLVENTASLRKQNDVLKKEAIELKREANDIRSSYELQVEVILKHNEVLKKQHTSTSSELSNLRGKYEVLNREFEKMKCKEEQTVPTIVHTTAIEECKTLLDELKYQYENEKRSLSNHIKRMEENQPENEKQLIMVIAERNHLKGLAENLEKNFKRAQRKIEHMQSMVYSSRVSHDSLKEQLSKATAYCEELFSEYERIFADREKLVTRLRETEKENANVDRLETSITSRVEGLKNQLEIVRKGAKQQVDSVEKRIKLQEVHVRRMKHDYQSKIQHLNDVIKEKEDIIEKFQKQKRSSQNDATREASESITNNKAEQQ